MADVTTVRRCPECTRTNQRSTVEQLSRMLVAASEFTVETGGKRISGGGFAETTLTFQCSRGHRWTETDRRPFR